EELPRGERAELLDERPRETVFVERRERLAGRELRGGAEAGDAPLMPIVCLELEDLEEDGERLAVARLVEAADHLRPDGRQMELHAERLQALDLARRETGRLHRAPRPASSRS